MNDKNTSQSSFNDSNSQFNNNISANTKDNSNNQFSINLTVFIKNYLHQYQNKRLVIIIYLYLMTYIKNKNANFLQILTWYFVFGQNMPKRCIKICYKIGFLVTNKIVY